MLIREVNVKTLLFALALLAGSGFDGAGASAAAAANLPATMRAAALDHGGGPEVLTLHTLPIPAVGPQDVLIALDTAGVASWDASIRQDPDSWGKHRSRPLVLGTDGSGHVAALGSAVQGFKLGDAVYAYSFDNPQGGFYAEYVAVAADHVGHVPANLDLRDAGAIGTTALTALQGIDDALHLKTGQSLIIHGAAGGVGTLAIQFAKLRGVKVLATVSGQDGEALARRLGADAVVDGRSGDILAAAHALAPGGVDAVLALAGGAPLERCMDALHPGGLLAFPSGVEPEPKRNGLHIVAYDAIPNHGGFDRLNAAIATMKLQVPIAAEYPLSEAAKSHERLAAGHVLGKVVLRMH
jgi:NADPH2:quinone reductase